MITCPLLEIKQLYLLLTIHIGMGTVKIPGEILQTVTKVLSIHVVNLAYTLI